MERTSAQQEPEPQPPLTRAIPAASDAVRREERKLRRHLGFWALTAVGFSDIVGSGWLFSALYAAQTAGPLSLLSWVAAGALAMLVALVLVDLAARMPEAGGTVRWPLYANGPLVAGVISWAVLLSVGANAAEVTATVQYLTRWFPGLHADGRLSWPGVGVAIVLTVVFATLNWFGVRLFTRVNIVLTLVKTSVPVLTVVLLLASGFHPHRLTDHGGFAPYGWSAGLAALSAGGVIYAVNGFQAPVDLAGEARDPRRHLRAAVLTAIGLAILLYVSLQLAFLFAVPDSALAHGWRGVDLTSPFGQLALLINLHWLALMLYADAVVSPGGATFVGVGINARRSYALAKNGMLPRWFLTVHAGSGIPRRALALNVAVMTVYLLPFGTWQDVVGTLGNLFLLVYATSAVAAATLRPAGQPAGAMRWITPLSFLVATLFVYWSTWHRLRLTLPLALAGVPLSWLVRSGRGRFPLRRELRDGAWLLVWLTGLLCCSVLGSFGGSGLIPQPYDTLSMVVFAAGVFAWAVRSGRRHVAEAHPTGTG
ncbi:APC family permease [Streptomyces sp. PBH53]|uniref:APC family permease n=1 Tax=Streptomyces sp. PBH53 TaxID=1577075 RepID=UPI0028FCC923|nr:APC family permease [Streptomyces sp. PBH53]